jgi:hypothetical protein
MTHSNATKQTPATKSHSTPTLSECTENLSVESVVEQGLEYVVTKVRKHPESAALWCLGIGFVLGWKLKPW